MDWSSADQASEIHQTSDRRKGTKAAHSIAEEQKWLQLDARKGMFNRVSIKLLSSSHNPFV